MPMSLISSAATSKTRRKDSQEFSNQRSVIRAKSSKRRLPITDTCSLIGGHSSVGRALEWHSRGRRFNSAWLHQNIRRRKTSFPLMPPSCLTRRDAALLFVFSCPICV